MAMRLRLFGRPAAPRSRAFTLIEVLSSVVVGTMLMFFVYKFLSGTRFNFLYGTVNLQNLHDAQMAINYLRRDFSSSCPMLSSRDPYVTREQVRRQIFNVQGMAPTHSKLIEIDPGTHRLYFHRFNFNTALQNATPTVEPVEYIFDSTRRTLTRTGAGKKVVFEGFDDVAFKVYVHELNPKVPMLAVKLVVNEGRGNQYNATEGVGRPLELTTSITSGFIDTNINNLTWNYELCHQ